MKRLLASVLTSTLVTMSAGAWADDAHEPAPPGAEPTQAATPLTTRASPPLSLAPTDQPSHVGYKLFAFVVVVLGAGVWLRRKRGRALATPKARVDVLGRTSVGVRSELVVIEVDRTRLLVGVTPGTIQTLAVLDPAEPVEVAASTAELAAEPAEVAASPAELAAEPAGEGETGGIGRRALLDLRRMIGPRAAASPSPAPRRPRSTSKFARVAGQAKGLLLALEEPVEDGGPAARSAARPSERNAPRAT